MINEMEKSESENEMEKSESENEMEKGESEGRDVVKIIFSLNVDTYSYEI